MLLKELGKELTKEESNISLGFHIASGESILSLLLRGDISTINLKVFPVLNHFFAIGTLRRKNGAKFPTIILNVPAFLETNIFNHPGFMLEKINPSTKTVGTISQNPIFIGEKSSCGIDNIDYIKHSMIIGGSGTGKSKLLELFVNRISDFNNNSHIILIDPHGEFENINLGKTVNFVDNYIEPFASEDKSPKSTELIVDLIIGSLEAKNPYVERVLYYTIHFLNTKNKLDFDNLQSLLTDQIFRKESMMECKDDEIRRFFEIEYLEIYTQRFDEVILPILNFISEYKLYLKTKNKKKESLKKLIENNKITVISLNPSFFGKRMIKFLGGSIIHQMYIMAVSGKFKEKNMILVVDEFPRVESKTVINILSECRKFNLGLYLSMQYLNQINKNIIDSILTNVFNYYIFKVNKEDAKILNSVLDIKLDPVFEQNKSSKEIEILKEEMLTGLDQRECIVKIFDGQIIYDPVKLRTVDVI